MDTKEGPSPLWLALCRRVGAPADISLDRLREKLNEAVGRGTLQRIKSGVKGTPLSTFKKLAAELGCAPQDLMAEAGEGHPAYATDWRKAGELIANQSPTPRQREILLDFLTAIECHMRDAQRIAASIPDITER